MTVGDRIKLYLGRCRHSKKLSGYGTLIWVVYQPSRPISARQNCRGRVAPQNPVT